jgi:hypothetical protein
MEDNELLYPVTPPTKIYEPICKYSNSNMEILVLSLWVKFHNSLQDDSFCKIEPCDHVYPPKPI